MGCQCAKSEETKSNIDLETAPPKTTFEDNGRIEISAKNSLLGAAGYDPVNQSKVDSSIINGSRVDDSKSGKRKKKIKKSNENFAEELFKMINIVRQNPSDFAERIEKAIVNIKVEEGGKLIFDADGTKVALITGSQSFFNVAELLRNTEPAPVLVYKNDLIISVPEDQKEWKIQKTITDLLQKKRADNGNLYQEYVFNMDLGVSDPETCLMLQIIDDSPFKGKRRENILNPKMTSVGISFLKIKTKFCAYITFAN